MNLQSVQDGPLSSFGNMPQYHRDGPNNALVQKHIKLESTITAIHHCHCLLAIRHARDSARFKDSVLSSLPSGNLGSLRSQNLSLHPGGFTSVGYNVKSAMSKLRDRVMRISDAGPR